MGVLPAIHMGAMNVGANIDVEFGYDARLWLLPDLSGLSLGCNLVAILFTVLISRYLRSKGIATWPLMLKQIP